MNENLTRHEKSEDGNEIRSEIELNGRERKERPIIVQIRGGGGGEDKGNDYSVKSSCCHYSFEYFSHHHHHWNHGEQNEPIAGAEIISSSRYNSRSISPAFPLHSRVRGRDVRTSDESDLMTQNIALSFSPPINLGYIATRSSPPPPPALVMMMPVASSSHVCTSRSFPHPHLKKICTNF